MSKKNKGIIQKITKSRSFKGLCLCLAFNILSEIISPTVAMALTEGPSQPEVQSFEPISTTQMVDLFSGDFNYNIPLFNLPGPNGGYPVNLAYHAGVSMDDEASWVGLGWNINVGSLNRTLRGIPDEFLSELGDSNKDHYYVKQDVKPSVTFGATFNKEHEIVGGKIPPKVSGVNAGLSIYYNNYKGLGLGLNVSADTDRKFDFGLSLDSENGFGFTINRSTNSKMNQSKWSHALSLNFGGRLSTSYNMTRRKGKRKFGKNKGTKFGVRTRSIPYSYARYNFSLASNLTINSYNLTFGISGKNSDVSFFQKGRNISGFYNTQDIKNSQKKGRAELVVGYENLGDTYNSKTEYLKDFSRHNEGNINKNSPILPNSYYNHDIYHSTGQGVISYFRPKRTDVGYSSDPELFNNSSGIGLSLDLGSGNTQKVGFDVNVNVGSNKQGTWSTKNELNTGFNSSVSEGREENLYYKGNGEQTIEDLSQFDHFGGTEIIKTKFKASGKKKREMDPTVSYDNDGPEKRYKRNTNITKLLNKEVGKLPQYDVGYYTNVGDGDILYEEPNETLNREERATVIGNESRAIDISSHNAGFSILNENGSHYNYALPAYNIRDIENNFTIAENDSALTTIELDEHSEVDYKLNGTDKYIKRIEKTPYAHSYLLTSVLGADYVDLTQNGISQDDLGYWVKFSYVKSADDYKWRAPYSFNKAFYNKGHSYKKDDDKGTYSYGEKELWYLGKIETKSHVAVFIPKDDRTDNLEASGELSNDGASKHGMAIKEIRIYEKSNFGPNAIPLKVVHFDYNYELCKGIENSSESNGKLTLKKVWFTSLGSNRGVKNSYEFGYAGTTNNDVSIPNSNTDYAENLNGINPVYVQNSYDSWRMFKYKLFEDDEHNSNFPYVNQFNQDFTNGFTNKYEDNPFETKDTKDLTQKLQNNLSSAWCLKRIKLPSGGTINIDYESDDYGYVQHMTANQMFKIAKTGDNDNDDIGPDELYGASNSETTNLFHSVDDIQDEKNRRIYFKLEEPILATLNDDVIAQKIWNDYVDPLKKNFEGEPVVYFKSKMRITLDVFDYVRGYLPLENSLISDDGNGSIVYNYGVLTSNTDDLQSIYDGKYNYGYITLAAGKKKNGDNFKNYHPMSLIGWGHLQTNTPELLSNPNSYDSDEINNDNIGTKLADILNILPGLAGTFGNIRGYCKRKDMARYIDLNSSVIRLASPDKKKFGGGHRVKQISISDNWSADTGSDQDSRTYGQVFEYTTIDETNGNVISSGVAAYEPQAGGDENALKAPINYFAKGQYAFTNNNLFSEEPLNESFYPGASVGYSKITVKSLNTQKQLYPEDGSNSNGRTGGVSVSEFFTAKDFPTIEERTTLKEGGKNDNNVSKSVLDLQFPIPFIGSFKRQFYHGTQGFLIEKNDMHGKPKSSRTYEINSYEINSEPITSVSYEYDTREDIKDGVTILRVNSNVSTLLPDGSFDQNNNLMGVEVDLYTDQVESSSYNVTIGFAIGYEQLSPPIPVEVPGIPIPVPVPIPPIPEFWPEFSSHKTLYRTFVTNKVVQRSGILKKVISKDVQSKNEVEYLAYDTHSGTPALTSTKNEFGDMLYKFDFPAYYYYNRMGHAYTNISYNYGLPIATIDLETNNGSFVNFIVNDNSEIYNNLVRGDEVLVHSIVDNELDVPDFIIDSPFNYEKGYFLGFVKSLDGSSSYAKFHFPSISQPTDVTNANILYNMKVIRSGRRNHFSAVAASYLMKGELNPNLDVDFVASYPSGVNELSESTFTMNNIISASANIYKDDWANLFLNSWIEEGEYELSQSTQQNVGITKNPFLTGASGIWRPYKAYTYVGERSTSLDLEDETSEPNLKVDGVMDNVPFFHGLGMNYERLIEETEWEWVNEITRFSKDAYEVENTNRIGVNSSALFGYDNSLSIAVGGNASYNELGTYDFEMDGASSFKRLLNQTNLNFDANHSASVGYVTEQFSIIRGEAVPNSDEVILYTSVPFNEFSSGTFEDNMVLTLNPKTITDNAIKSNEGYYLNAQVQSFEDERGLTKMRVKPYIDDVNEEVIEVEGEFFEGKISLLTKRTYSEKNSSSINVSTDISHTGKQSLKLENGVHDFEQPLLQLEKDKKYIMSLWISKNDKTLPDYFNDDMIKVGVWDGNSTAINSDSIELRSVTKSKIIEGWQKIDIEVLSKVDRPYLSFQINTDNQNLYLDDIRFSPKTGGITTYVYDAQKYWLRASLNVDNYATLFFYDEEGNLVLKKQETEKGIFTITESRGHVSED